MNNAKKNHGIPIPFTVKPLNCVSTPHEKIQQYNSCFQKSISNIRYSIKDRDLYYDREAVKYHQKMPVDENFLKKYIISCEANTKNLSSPDYKYDNE